MEFVVFLLLVGGVVGFFVLPAVRRRKAAKEAMGGMTRSNDPGAYGFVPADELDVRLPGPDHELVDALTETQRTQDWQPMARLLALTDDDWELRWQRVQSAAGAAAMELARARAAEGPPKAPADPADLSTVSFTKNAPSEARQQDARWLRDWRAQQPGDRGAAQVYAQFLVWQALADPGSADHRIVLEEARNAAREAAALAEADPTPYITELFAARALGDRRADFQALWDEVVRRAPHHMGAHLAALPYWSQKWHGSREDAYAFAEGAAARAPEGSLLPALPLFAVYDHLPDANLVRGMYQSQVVRDAIEAAEYAVDGADDDHPVRAHVLHLLVCFLVRAERYEEAMQAVQAVDGYVGALPWVESPEPAAAYAAYRALAVAGYERRDGDAATAPPPPSQ
ncbi:hypothetical protein V1J52_06460 [Streptomyces sp. TRM 70351]|uniref:hypothetical protein n=1 Tax=Streptomyces sp. TRM 70351 TaxID=3116552 RepID=UPI002E7C0A61|nr:hypothetical protein [Streptomyces sp. TRM 70351]MEE1927837.1 hypothetical protein [Streptomyces sp. TRM 70351]